MHLSIPIGLAVSTLLAIGLAVDHRALAQPADVRTITMRVAADEGYRALPDWETTLRNTVQAVSDIYEKHFQIRFVILDIVPFPVGQPGMRNRMQTLVTDVPIGEAEFLIGVSGRCEEPVRGVARSFDRFAVIMARCGGTEPLPGHGLESVLSHELAHLFGAFHPAVSVDSVMRSSGGPPDLFDDQTARVIRLMRSYDFRRGILALDEATRRAWRAIYAEGHQRNNEVNPLVSALTNAGVELARSGKPTEGEAAIREAIKIDQLLPEPHAALGTVYARRGLLEEAAHEFRLAKSLKSTHVGARTELGFVLLRLGKHQEALPEFEIVLRINPEMVGARVGLCTALTRGNRLDEAIRECTEAIRLAPEDGRTFSARGSAYGRKGELDRAIQDYDQAIRLSPGLAAAFDGRGLVHRRKGDFDRAIEDFDQAIRLQPTVAGGWNNRCFTRAIAGRLEEALADCDESLRLQPKSVAALDSRGLTYLKLGHLDRAIADYDAALRIDRNHAHALYGRGLAKRKKGDHRGAEADLAAARVISPRIAEEYAGYAVAP